MILLLAAGSNSSTLNDGASAVLLMSEAALKEHGKRPLARYVSSGTAGVSPRVMGVGPRAAALSPDAHVQDLTSLRVEPGPDGTIRLYVTG